MIMSSLPKEIPAAGVAEAQRHHPVAEDHRFFLSAVAIDHVDQVGESFFVITRLMTLNGIFG
jgi:hypothetical protein